MEAELTQHLHRGRVALLHAGHAGEPGKLSPVAGGVRWKDRLAMVVDPEPPRDGIAIAVQKPVFPGREVIKPGVAVEVAVRHLQERGTLENDRVRKALENAQPGPPLLVRATDQRAQLYYIVRFQVEGADSVLVALDARFGSFIEAMALTRPEPLVRVRPEEIPRLLAEGVPIEDRLELARDQLLRRITRMLETIGPVSAQESRLREITSSIDVELARLIRTPRKRPLDPEEVVVHPVMAWQPSTGGYSMLFPYYVVSTPERQIYVNSFDGQIRIRLGYLFLRILGG